MSSVVDTSESSSAYPLSVNRMISEYFAARIPLDDYVAHNLLTLPGFSHFRITDFAEQYWQISRATQNVFDQEARQNRRYPMILINWKTTELSIHPLTNEILS